MRLSAVHALLIVMHVDRGHRPTPFRGQPAQDALAGKRFEIKRLR